MGLKVPADFFRIFKNQRRRTPAGDPDHFGVMGFSDDDDLSSLLLCLSDKALNAAHIGTRRINDISATHCKRVQGFFAFSVRANEDTLPSPGFLRRADLTHAGALQLLDDAGVMDNTAEHRAAAFFSGILRNSDSARHSVAKPRCFCENHLHKGFPPTSCPPRA